MINIEKIFYSFVFLADQTYNKKVYIVDKITVFFQLLITFGPVAFLLKTINLWFDTNKEFVSAFLVVVAINAHYGIKKHRRLDTFKWEIFYKKTGEMLSYVIAIYILLSIIGNFSGDSIVSEAFQILIQVSTLFYPISKAVKSIHILSNGEYPSEFIMKKFYNFKKYGDMEALFKSKEVEKEEEKTE